MIVWAYFHLVNEWVGWKGTRLVYFLKATRLDWWLVLSLKGFEWVSWMAHSRLGIVMDSWWASSLLVIEWETNLVSAMEKLWVSLPTGFWKEILLDKRMRDALMGSL